MPKVNPLLVYGFLSDSSSPCQEKMAPIIQNRLRPVDSRVSCSLRRHPLLNLKPLISALKYLPKWIPRRKRFLIEHYGCQLSTTMAIAPITQKTKKRVYFISRLRNFDLPSTEITGFFGGISPLGAAFFFFLFAISRNHAWSNGIRFDEKYQKRVKGKKARYETLPFSL